MQKYQKFLKYKKIAKFKKKIKIKQSNLNFLSNKNNKIQNFGRKYLNVTNCQKKINNYG